MQPHPPGPGGGPCAGRGVPEEWEQPGQPYRILQPRVSSFKEGLGERLGFARAAAAVLTSPARGEERCGAGHPAGQWRAGAARPPSRLLLREGVRNSGFTANGLGKKNPFAIWELVLIFFFLTIAKNIQVKDTFLPGVAVLSTMNVQQLRRDGWLEGKVTQP